MFDLICIFKCIILILVSQKEILQFVHEMNSEVMNYVEWNACGERCYIKDISALERTELLQCLVNKCFNEAQAMQGLPCCCIL